MTTKQDGFGHEKPGEGQTNDWITPKWVFDKLGEFDLDPCESNNQPWTSAKRGYRLCRGEDGLALEWDAESVYCNPPYGPHVTHWIDKAIWHGNTTMLIFARVETKAWWKIWTGAHGILFPNKRISFFQPDGKPAKSGTAPSAFVAFGTEAAERLKWAKIPGAYIYQGWSCYDGTEDEEEEAGDADSGRGQDLGEDLQLLLGGGENGVESSAPGMGRTLRTVPAIEEV